MKSKIAFTKIDLVVTFACLVFLLMSLGAIGSRGRERAKRAVCLTNLKQLTLAWTQYADDNDDKIVSGSPTDDSPNYDVAVCNAFPPREDSWLFHWHHDEVPWVGVAWAQSWGCSPRLDKECQLMAIESGALYPYCKNVKLYRCPAGVKEEMLNYSVMDGMNGWPRDGADQDNPGVWIKRRTEINNPPPAYRMVFIDEGFVTPDSFAVYYASEEWFDNPPSRHGGGVTLSFADGHSDFYKWKGFWTIEYAKANAYSGRVPKSRPGAPIDMTPCIPYDDSFKRVTATDKDCEDLHYIQKGCWGRLKDSYEFRCPD